MESLTHSVGPIDTNLLRSCHNSNTQCQYNWDFPESGWRSAIVTNGGMKCCEDIMRKVECWDKTIHHWSWQPVWETCTAFFIGAKLRRSFNSWKAYGITSKLGTSYKSSHISWWMLVLNGCQAFSLSKRNQSIFILWTFPCILQRSRISWSQMCWIEKKRIQYPRFTLCNCFASNVLFSLKVKSIRPITCYDLHHK